MTQQSAQKVLDSPNAFTSIKARLSAPSPKIFNKIIIIAIACGGAGTTLVNIPDLPHWVYVLSHVMMAAGGAALFIAKMTFDKDKVLEIANDTKQKNDETI